MLWDLHIRPTFQHLKLCSCFGLFFLKYSYNNFFGNWYPKLLRLPQKYHDTEGSLVFSSIAKNGRRPYTQSLLFLICTLAGMIFFTVDDRSHNFARYDRAGAGRNRGALRVYCSPPWTRPEGHTSAFSTGFSWGLCAALFLPFQPSSPKESNWFLSGKYGSVKYVLPYFYFYLEILP